jgi:hypothetical protein
VTVEEVTGRSELRRFTELPQALHGTDSRFAPLLMAWERYRLDPRRNPYFEDGDAAYLLARRLGRPVGRVVAHVAEPGGAGRFGFWWTVDDESVASALLDAAQRWLEDRGCTSMEGPLSFTAEEEAGALVIGHEVPGLTGRPWHPPHLAGLLAAAGLEPEEDRPTWRLQAVGGGPSLPPGDDAPGHAGSYADRRLALQGVAAVPDVAEALRSSAVRDAWRLAARARRREWSTCTIVRCDTDPSVGVTALQAAAADAGYRWVVSPWSPDPTAAPETVHRLFRRTWGQPAAA